MKEKSLFDVWIRMKPFLPAFGGVSEHYSAEGSSPSNPNSKLKRNRSKSPRLVRTPISEREKNIGPGKKPDYKAFHVEDGKIVLEEPNEEVVRGSRVNPKSINFPHIIQDSDSNISIFKRSLEPKITQVFEGSSFTLLTYGISGSGKSHTIFGSQIENFKEKGLLFYFMQGIFERKSELEAVEPNQRVQVSASFIEIYNEQVRDLLAEEPSKKLSIIESPFTNGVLVPDLTSKNLNCFSEMSNGLQLALSRRVVCPNVNNNFSSRSHLIVEIIIKTFKEGDEFSKKTAKVRFVDLAGSEKVSLEAKDIIQEGANINKSLLSLTNCINILSDGKKREDTFIPYRNSKLTRLLKDSLGGDTPVLMIVCISPNSCYIEETLNSLKYAQKAKKIKEQKLISLSSIPYSSANLNTQNKKIELLEKEVKYLKGLIMARNSDTPSKTPQVVRNISWTEEGEVDTGKEEEFDELLEALIENIEDLNVLRQNIAEIDNLIIQNDQSILEIQQKIADSNEYQFTQKLYKELKLIADKLEENLDLKENALSEVDKLNQTIKCTKLALRKMYSYGRSQPRRSNESESCEKALEPPTPQVFMEDAPMISSTRGQDSLLEEIRKRDLQIASLTQALRNLSKLEHSGDLYTQCPDKENEKNFNSSYFQGPCSGTNSKGPEAYESLKEVGLSGLELSLMSKGASMDQVVNSLAKIFKPVTLPSSTMMPAKSTHCSKGNFKLKLTDFESDVSPSVDQNPSLQFSNIDVAYHHLDYFSSAHKNMNSTNPMSIGGSSSEGVEVKNRQVLAEIEQSRFEEEENREKAPVKERSIYEDHQFKRASSKSIHEPRISSKSRMRKVK